MDGPPGPITANPGASVHGNFANYYSFHPTAERISQMPDGLVAAEASRHHGPDYVALDIGCNSGDLTLELLAYLRRELPTRRIWILGVDLDARLIERARLQNRHPDAVSFECLDFTGPDRGPLLDAYLRQRRVCRFHVTFCFSVTMWIHLNGGDAGLERFLRDVCASSEAVLLEPQPWRCYRNAARRLRRAGLPGFPQLEQLRYRGDPMLHVRAILSEQCGFRELAVSERNDWQRRLLLYARPALSGSSDSAESAL
ncbi:pre-miRNA 5'-monophosphate methyltransferase isoform X2 [Phymastichus coffea]|nr:pre-miRNA 5'-monophosphate methyltransferase isoform X2 [Phymastichus coffea]XP_058807583.1 pre-miRNA 5'-monophosphate methyltransferase isoform X2 [Phymastichus coffea]XP_058807584.1 pre-miRNA 5'-monophosphate methyltransferase isoform X2 [Phymastichus coffea]XP_058807585.1 pre-miRNA 5'-monophosphate methyltransferase isoform X2 [Phymastichus coffea]XP_058807586.1 pre-miRNA 5'-monophosphate methyltransferase isoform X2 [Phymastichus coffea]